MCGITGFIGFNDRELLEKMCSSLVHRGPDHAGYYTENNVSLAMRRLAVIDLESGNQPISNEDETAWVVFNGEIYNYQILREELVLKGHHLKTNSDTETIVHLYEEYGEDFVSHLRGMFGIALWDKTKKKLILARDRIGEKPLYYSFINNKLLFGSEIKAILHGLDRRSVCHQSVCDYLACGYVGGKNTFFNEILKLRPGELLIFQDGTINTKKYWTPNFDTKSTLSYKEAKDHIAREMDDAVKLCLKSDLEVGAFLSGGIDSSVLVALMKKHKANVKTFSVGYAGEAKGFNELQYAKIVADHLGTEHHELILDAFSSIDLLPKIISHYDEPHGEPTSVLVYLLCEFVKKHVTVAISGTGGDEIFYGYPKHVGIRYYQHYKKIPSFFREHVIEKILGSIPESTTGGRLAKRINRFISGANKPIDDAYMTWVNLLHKDIRESLFSSEVLASVDNPLGDSFLQEHLHKSKMKDIFDRVTSLDIEGYLPEYQLTYMDRMSMAHSLEVRAPLCDYKLVEETIKLPVSYRLKGTTTKKILKDIASQWLPDSIVNRKKVGFDSPIGQWFKQELKPFIFNFLSEENICKTGLLDPPTVTLLINDHMTGKKDYSLQIWSILSLECWYRMYIEMNLTDASSISLIDIRGAMVG